MQLAIFLAASVAAVVTLLVVLSFLNRIVLLNSSAVDRAVVRGIASTMVDLTQGTDSHEASVSRYKTLGRIAGLTEGLAILGTMAALLLAVRYWEMPRWVFIVASVISAALFLGVLSSSAAGFERECRDTSNSEDSRLFCSAMNHALVAKLEVATIVLLISVVAGSIGYGYVDVKQLLPFLP